jgi:ATP-dependent DNA helicase DinG
MADESLRDLLGSQGALSRALPNYEPREPQLTMAERVESAMTHGRALLVEAGTGTGKTLAYLLPAARSGHKVVVSTATKTLQEQLLEKDVPLVKQLGVQARFAFLKGRQNYLCLLRFEQFHRQPTFLIKEEGALYDSIARWADETRTGDKSELEGLPENLAVWRDLSATGDQCIGQKCSYYNDCFVFKMRREAGEADVVIVNHHLFFADLALRSSSAGDAGIAVLPRYDAVVFDEAHAIEEVATEHFGSSLSSFRVLELARDVLKKGKAVIHATGLAKQLEGEGRDFFEAAMSLAPGQSDRWSIPPGGLKPAEEQRQKLQDLLSALASSLMDAKDKNDDDDEIELLERRAVALVADIAEFSDEARSERMVHWAESRMDHLFLHSSPVQIATILQEKLYDKIGPVVFTSATLAVGGRLDYFAQRVGLADETGPLFPLEQKVLASPFDYERNAALYLPKTMPDPMDEQFPNAVADELRRLLPITGGRAFALFTSLKNMRAVHGQLAKELPYQVLLQGELPKAQILKKFREKPSVLFASQSFWEGVDVAGEALSMVVIDKLPFASPQEPLVAARIDRLRQAGEDAFYAYQVPQAALALKQGFGRLIRSASDRGIVAILDARMTRKGYGRVFVESLPKCRIVRSPEEARSFWKSV